MKFYLVGVMAILLLVILSIAGIVMKAINSSAVYLDGSFRWGGRDDK